MLIFELGCTVLLPYDGIYFQSQRLKQDLIGGSWEPYPIFLGSWEPFPSRLISSLLQVALEEASVGILDTSRARL